MSYRLVLIDKDGIEFDERIEPWRQGAINRASALVNATRAVKVKVYSGYTRIYTARVPE